MNYRDAWFQQLVPCRTQCLRCGAQSPVVHIPAGALTFGGPVGKNEVDVSAAAMVAFGEVEWQFGELKSYCPSCQGLGT